VIGQARRGRRGSRSRSLPHLLLRRPHSHRARPRDTQRPDRTPLGPRARLTHHPQGNRVFVIPAQAGTSRAGRLGGFGHENRNERPLTPRWMPAPRLREGRLCGHDDENAIALFIVLRNRRARERRWALAAIRSKSPSKAPPCPTAQAPSTPTPAPAPAAAPSNSSTSRAATSASSQASSHALNHSPHAHPPQAPRPASEPRRPTTRLALRAQCAFRSSRLRPDCSEWHPPMPLPAPVARWPLRRPSPPSTPSS